MSRRRKTTLSQLRSLAKLFRRKGGVYDMYRQEGWRPSMPSFLYGRTHSFSALGHRWTIRLTVSVWHKFMDATIVLDPEDPLSPPDIQRLQTLGFYGDMAALFSEMGFWHPWTSMRGDAIFVRWLPGVSKIPRIQSQFDQLEFDPGRPYARPPIASKRTQKQTRELLTWGRRQRGDSWFPVCLEFRKPSRERARGLVWRTRRVLILGPTSSCSWFYAWPPKHFKRKDWNAVENSGFFRKTTKELQALGQKGYWRPGLFRDPDRLAAEFWKPQRKNPSISWEDFQSLLQWRLAGH